MMRADKPGVGIAHAFYALTGTLKVKLCENGEGSTRGTKARPLGNVELRLVMLGVGMGLFGLPTIFAGQSALVNMDRVPLIKLNSA
jgi:hypothetical protein